MLCVLTSGFFEENLFNIKYFVFSPLDNSIHLFPSLPLHHRDESGVYENDDVYKANLRQLRTHLNLKYARPTIQWREGAGKAGLLVHRRLTFQMFLNVLNNQTQFC